ncbi:MAG TPA: SDR family oxidoreductase, partial [Xanthobacteraceae bacterium]|nr:SDR family oxidoreductase [Xanthobacteraceae bacterium]
FFLAPDAPARRAIEVVGPQRLTVTEVLLAYRNWLGLPKPHLMPLPRWLARLMFRFGDFLGLLGWRPPVRSTAEREIVLGATGDPAQWTALTGISPRSLAAALAAEPASVQEKWFARLYMLKPLVFGVLAAFWLGTGIVSLGPGYGIGLDVMRAGNVEGPLAVAAVIGGGLTDIAIGLGMIFRRTARLAMILSLVVSVVYFILGTYLVPALWIDPLGPMMKIWPICVLALVAIAIDDDR